VTLVVTANVCVLLLLFSQLNAPEMELLLTGDHSIFVVSIHIFVMSFFVIDNYLYFS